MKQSISNTRLFRIAQVLSEQEESTKEVESIQELQNRLSETYNVDLWLGNNPEGFTLDKLVVQEDEQGGGIGSQVMEELIAYADTNGLTIATTPDDMFGSDLGRLKQFYSNFGFVPNKGKNKDFSFRETFIRYPN